MARDWRGLVDSSLTDVQKLVHLAMRRDPYDEENIRLELQRIRREAYEDELSDQARRVGCPGRAARLSDWIILAMLYDQSKSDAAGIVNTYNYDLAVTILNIAAEAPRANRHVYAKRLQAWEGARSAWKAPQIEQYAQSKARSRAQADFYQRNPSPGYAELKPEMAVCPVCQGWVNRGKVPISVAMNNPPPYHPNCPHEFSVYPGQFASEECALIWLGE